MDGDGPAMPRPRHATRWSSTLRQPCVPVWLPRWSPVEMVSGCTGRRRFLSTGTGKGLQAPLRWKPSQPSFPHASVTPRALGGEALQCPTPFLGWKSHPVPSHQFKHKRKLQHQTTALCGTQLPRPCPQTHSLGGPGNAQQCSKRPGFQGHHGLGNSEHTFCRICRLLQDPAAAVRWLMKKLCILPLHPRL